MKIILTKLTGSMHAVEVIRANADRERVELSTKDFMPHDLIHYVYEREAGMHRSFWGMIASGKTFDDFQDKQMMADLLNPEQELTEAHITELITGALTGMLKNNLSNAEAMSMFANMFEARVMPIPAHLDSGFLDRFRIAFRSVYGEWSALKMGQSMELVFDEAAV